MDIESIAHHFDELRVNAKIRRTIIDYDNPCLHKAALVGLALDLVNLVAIDGWGLAKKSRAGWRCHVNRR
ncbi:hypothetical protein [Novosphingopyxis sp.]|uniref:hypothetical protein n=1 Tax=Novosphingopyxis sp. TaxID=2709690 RepID=UPI003B5BD516